LALSQSKLMRQSFARINHHQASKQALNKYLK
jgi:hypothetical protein